MTEQTDYKQQVLSEIVLVAGDPNATIEQVEDAMATLYGQHEQRGDATGMQLISDAWQRMQMVHNQTGIAIDMAAAARVVAEQMQTQRDGAVKLHNDLRQAVQKQDGSDPDVAALIEDAYQSAEEEFNEALYYGEAYYSDDPAYDIVECSGIPVNWAQATTFFNILCSNTLDDISEDVIATAMRDELAAFITQYVEKYQVITKAQFESEFPKQAAS